MGKARAAPKAIGPAQPFPSDPPPADPWIIHARGKLRSMAQEPTPPDSGDESRADAQALDPQRLLRIAGVTREVLEEARRIRPEPGALDHLRRVHDQINTELREALPEEL